MADTEQKATFALLLTLDVLEFMGFLVNYEKSVLIPSQKIFGIPSEFSRHVHSNITGENSKNLTQSLLLSPTPSAREIARVVGILSSCIPAVMPAPLHYRALQATKNLAIAVGGYDHRISLPHAANYTGGTNISHLTMGNQ